jgi:hypothetical protein
MAQAVEHLPSKPDTLSLNPSNHTHKKKDEEEETKVV